MGVARKSLLELFTERHDEGSDRILVVDYEGIAGRCIEVPEGFGRSLFEGG